MASPTKLGATLVVLTLAVAACGHSTPSVDLPSGAAARELGACRSDWDAWAGPEGTLVTAERWLHLAGGSADLAAAARSSEEGTLELRLRVQDVPADPPRVERVAVFSSFVEGLDWAVRSGADAFLALAHTGLERELTSYIVIRHPDGAYFFTGDCAYDNLTAYFRRAFGAGYDAAIGHLVGLTGRARIDRFLCKRDRAWPDSGGSCPGA